MSKLGKKLIRRMKDFIGDAKAGKAFDQSIVRRMKVKGKTVYTHERFRAPLKGKP